MDLTDIRSRIMSKARLKDVFAVDDAINQAQRQYIQPLALLPGLANVTVPGQRSIVQEANALDVTNTIYTATYSPFLPDTEQVFVGGTQRASTDVGFEHTVDDEAGTVVFAAPQANVEVSYITENSVKLTAVAGDIYLLTGVKWIHGSSRYTDIPLLPAFDAFSAGLRLYNDRIYLQGFVSEMTLAFQYWKMLSDLGSATGQVTTPQIGSQWHDLYWMGALTMLDLEKHGAMFFGILDRFKRDRLREHTPPGGRMKPIRWD